MGASASGAPPSAPKPTKRLPGRWADLTVTGTNLEPEASTTLPWLSAEDFERVVHQATDGAGFSFEHDLIRRPDVVLGERTIGLDTAETRRRVLAGAGLGAAGLVMIAVGFLSLSSAGAFGFQVVVLMAGTVVALAGFEVGTQGKWESDLLRVRLDPATTRVLGPASSSAAEPPRLSVKVFLGRVTSGSTGSQAGTFRTLQKVLPSPTLSSEATEIASRLAEVARKLPPSAGRDVPLPTAPGRASASRPSAHLAPLASQTGRPEWYDYPRWFVWVRVIGLVVPMILLIFGPMLMLTPWNYQRVDFTPAGPSTQAIPGESWSPTGATSGEVWWYTYDPATATEVNNVPVVVALCPIGTSSIDPGACRSVTGGPLSALTSADTSISIPSGWHLVANVTVSEICSGCHTSVRFDSPDVGLGLGLTLAGVAVLLPCVAVWQRTRARVRSAWPQ